MRHSLRGYLAEREGFEPLTGLEALQVAHSTLPTTPGLPSMPYTVARYCTLEFAASLHRIPMSLRGARQLESAKACVSLYGIVVHRERRGRRRTAHPRKRTALENPRAEPGSAANTARLSRRDHRTSPRSRARICQAGCDGRRTRDPGGQPPKPFAAGGASVYSNESTRSDPIGSLYDRVTAERNASLGSDHRRMKLWR